MYRQIHTHLCIRHEVQTSTTYSKGHCETSFHPSVPSSIRPSVHLSNHPSIHPSHHDLFTSTGRRKNGIQTRHGGKNNKKYSTGKDVVKHHFIHLSHHPSIHPSGHPSIPPWFVYFDSAEKEWNTDVARRRKQ